MGLPGSGKTSLAELLVPRLGAVWFNADAIRQEIHKDLGFSSEDRIEHARRLGKLSDWASMGGNFVVADFAAQPKKLETLLMLILLSGLIES